MCAEYGPNIHTLLSAIQQWCTVCRYSGPTVAVEMSTNDDDTAAADNVNDDDDNGNGSDISHNGLVGFRNRAYMRDLN